MGRPLGPWAVPLTISIAGGARLGTITNGMLAFGLYGLAFIANWVEQIGTMVGNSAAQQIGTIASLIMPSEALWQMAAFRMQPAILRELAVLAVLAVLRSVARDDLVGGRLHRGGARDRRAVVWTEGAVGLYPRTMPLRSQSSN